MFDNLRYMNGIRDSSIRNKIRSCIIKNIKSSRIDNELSLRCELMNYDEDCMNEMWILAEDIMKKFENTIKLTNLESSINIFERLKELFVVASILISDKILNDVSYCDTSVLCKVFKYTKKMILKAESILFSISPCLINITHEI